MSPGRKDIIMKLIIELKNGQKETFDDVFVYGWRDDVIEIETEIIESNYYGKSYYYIKVDDIASITEIMGSIVNVFKNQGDKFVNIAGRGYKYGK